MESANLEVRALLASVYPFASGRTFAILTVDAELL